MKAFKDIGISFAFVVILMLPFLESIFPFFPKTAITENRDLAPRPRFGSVSSDSFPTAFDAYYTDHFELRNPFLLFNSAFKTKVFDVPPVNTKGLLGADGWMYFTRNLKDAYLGGNRFNEEQLLRYYEVLTYRQRFLDSIGCAYYFVIVPVKPTIYPEFLPTALRSADQESASDQLVKLLDTVKEIKLIDLRPILREAKGGTRLFHKTDSHWNDYGAFLGYQGIMSRISDDFPLLEPRPISDFKIDSLNVEGMNLTRILGIYHDITEMNIRLTPEFAVQSTEGVESGYPAPKWFRFKSQYEEVYVTANDSLPKLLVTRDSFGKALMPYLNEHFSKSVYLFDGWHYGLHEDIVVKEKPDIFIQLVLESLLPNIPNNSSKP